MTSESYGKTLMLTNLVNGKRVLLPIHIGTTTENLLTFFSELNFREEYITKSQDTVYYRFHLQNLYIDLSSFKRGFYIVIYNNKEQKLFEHDYSNRIWTRRSNQKTGINPQYVESDISPILTSILDDIRYTWEASL
jgi:hypothetical protein